MENTYNSVSTSTVTALTTSAAKLIGTATFSRYGVRVLNLSSVNLYLKFIDNDATPPTATSMVTNGYTSVIVLPGATHYEDCGSGIDVYGCLASGTGNVCVEELS